MVVITFQSLFNEECHYQKGYPDGTLAVLIGLGFRNSTWVILSLRYWIRILIQFLSTKILFNISKLTIPISTGIGRKVCKSWFNDNCKQSIRDRKKALRIFKQHPTQDNLSSFRVARAKARRNVRQSKKESWQKYVSRLNSRTSVKATWDMVRKISGKFKRSTVSHLLIDNYRITYIKYITNKLAESFSFNSLSHNYTQ